MFNPIKSLLRFFRRSADLPKAAGPKPEHTRKPIATDVRERLDAFKEEETRRDWLPEPTARRRIVTRSHRPPAEEHRKSIAKHMKGKGRFAPWYRKSIEASPKIKIEEETD